MGLWISAVTGAFLVLLMWLGRGRRIWPGPELAEVDDAVTDKVSVKAWSVQILLIIVIHALSRNWGYWAESLRRSEVLSVLGAS